MPPKQAPQQGLAITTRAQWNAMPAKAANMTPLKGQWSRITVHHSAEETSDPVKARLDDSAHTVRLIQKYHMEDPEHHWGDIGYHFLIDSSGRIFQGRELKWQGGAAPAPASTDLTFRIRQALVDVQYGRAEDTFGWMRKIV